MTTARTPAELQGWCADTDAWLNDAEREVVERSAQAILLRAADLAESGEFRAGFDAPDDQSAAGTREQAPAAGELARADITRAAARLSADATADECQTVARAAERVLTARSQIEARNRLANMRERVDQANRKAAGRLAQATEAAQLLQPLAHAGTSVQPLRAELLNVVAGDIPLTSELRERARRAAADMQRAADLRYVRDSVTESLAELGYVIDEGFQTAVVRDGVLQVTRNEWQAHGVRMFLDEQKQELRALVVRTGADAGWDAARVDTERESQWCGIQAKLKAKLAARHITYEVRSVTEPGVRPVPSVQAGTGRDGHPPWRRERIRRDGTPDAEPGALSGHHARPGVRAGIWTQGLHHRLPRLRVARYLGGIPGRGDLDRFERKLSSRQVTVEGSHGPAEMRRLRCWRQQGRRLLPELRELAARGRRLDRGARRRGRARRRRTHGGRPGQLRGGVTRGPRAARPGDGRRQPPAMPPLRRGHP
jgi:hypothetical protein